MSHSVTIGFSRPVGIAQVSALAQVINRRSSGRRVNTAADDAAGLAIATS